MTCVIDKADDLKVIDCDSHFAEFVGLHPSKIKQGKLFLLDILRHRDRENVMRKICKKNARYTYMNFDIKGENDDYVYVHCTGQNFDDSSLCRLTLADVSRSIEKQEKLKAQAQEMNQLIDLVEGGVCLFKVTEDMHIEAIYLNESCCEIFGTTKENFISQQYRLDELIYKEDKSSVYQAIGQAMATKKPIDSEFRVVEHKDSYNWVKFNAAIHHYDDDNCPVFHAVISDITRIKQAEEKADRQYEMLVKLFKNLPGTFFCADDQNMFHLDFASADFYQLLGYKRSDFMDNFGGDLSKLIPPQEYKRALFDLKSQLANNTQISARYTLKTKSGAMINVVDERKVIDLENGDKTTLGTLKIAE